MNRFSVLFLILAVGLAACDKESGPATAKEVVRDIKGSEIRIVAPEPFVPICERSISVWSSVSKSVADPIHLLTCFVRQGEWETTEQISAGDLIPIMTVAIYRNMINETMSEEEFSGMLKVTNKPTDESRIVLHEDAAFCYSNRGKRAVKVEEQTEEFDAVTVTCLTLVKDKYLLLMLEDAVKNESDIKAAQTLAKEWVALMQKAN